MSLNSISQYVFPIMQGTPSTYSTGVEVLSRPNIDGSAIRRTGVRGVPFSMRTLTDVIDLADGRQTLTTYHSLQGDDPVALVHNDVDYYSIDGLYVIVLRVTAERLRAAGAIVGGLTSSPGAVLYTQWLLQFVEADA